MSGQWEVVGKKRDKLTKQNPTKLTKDTRKNHVINTPKIEDVCKLLLLFTIQFFLKLNLIIIFEQCQSLK